MRNRILFLVLGLWGTLPMWATTPTDVQQLTYVRQQVEERRQELQGLYAKHGLDENWGLTHLNTEELSEHEAALAAVQHDLKQLEAEINLIKIRQTHGLDLALSGMLIVFVGLAAISLFIGMLPRMLGWRERQKAVSAAPAPVAVPERASDAELDPGTLTAIAMVLHAEHERASGQNLKVTLGLNPSPWALSSQMRVLPGRIQS